MAYINQEGKARLALEIAKVMPTNWKYTLRIQNKSTLCLTIRQADVDLIGENLVVKTRGDGDLYRDLNEYNLQGEYSGKLLKIFESIKGAMMVGNHDRSDIQSDYFDVGWYIDIKIGEYDSPFRFVPSKKRDVCFGLQAAQSMISEFAPEGLDEAGQIEWLKNRIKELETA